MNYIWVTTQKEGYHYWADAPSEVSFLKHTHRHIFHFKVYIGVQHNDREIEFFMFKNDVVDSIDIIWERNNMLDIEYVNPLSCEMIADKIFEILKSKYTNREFMIEVSEDLENGCIMKYKS